jgi:hypothetical protein
VNLEEDSDNSTFERVFKNVEKYDKRNKSHIRIQRQLERHLQQLNDSDRQRQYERERNREPGTPVTDEIKTCKTRKTHIKPRVKRCESEHRPRLKVSAQDCQQEADALDIELLTAADRFQLADLVTLCVERLISTCTIKTLASRIILSDMMHMPRLKVCSLSFCCFIVCELFIYLQIASLAGIAGLSQGLSDFMADPALTQELSKEQLHFVLKWMVDNKLENQKEATLD